MDAHRFCTDLDSKPFYLKLYNPRWTHTPEEHKLERNIEVEELKMKNVLSQPALPL